MAKKYYWLKLKNDFFSQPRIKKLRRIAGGDTYTIIYLKMQLLSIQNEGKLPFEGIEESFAEEIALKIDEDIENVQVTLNFLFSQGILIEEAADEFLLPEVKASIGSETDSAERMRRKRVKDTEKLSKPSQCDADVTTCDTEVEVEVEKELELENKRERKIKHGKFKNVYLTEEQYKVLKETYENLPSLIDKISGYLANSSRTYRNHFALIDKIATEDKWPKKQKEYVSDIPECDPVPMPEEIRQKIKGY